MLVVGLTGGIGSGKSVVAQLFAERGVPVIDADQVSREVTQPGTPAFNAIVKHVGQHIVLTNGSLDRASLRRLIFDDAEERRWLEDLLHPMIREAMKKQVDSVSAPYCIAVIPLLLEVEFYGFINRILVVDAPEHLQIERVADRDQIAKPLIEAILKTQASRHDRQVRAQDVIINDKTLADLIPQVQALHEKYLKLAATASQ